MEDTNPESGNVDFSRLFGMLNGLQDVPQTTTSLIDGNALEHTMSVIKEVKQMRKWQELPTRERNIVFLAAIMHELGRKSKRRYIDKDGMCNDYALSGAIIARDFLYKYSKLDFTTREEISGLIKYHQLPVWICGNRDEEYKVIKSSLISTDYILDF